MRAQWRLVPVAALVVLSAACSSSPATKPSGSLSPASAAVASQAPSLWQTTVLAYPDDILAPAAKSVGQRSFPYRDIAVSGDLQLLAASARYAVLTDARSARLRLVDLQSGKVRLILSSPVSLRQPPSALWAKARAVMLRMFSRTDLPTEFLRAQVSGSRLVWQEALMVTTGGVDVVASAVFTASIRPGMKLGRPQLVTVCEPYFVADASYSTGGWYTGGGGLDFVFSGGRIVLFRGGGYNSGDKTSDNPVEVVDPTTNSRTSLIDAARHASAEVAMNGKRAVLCFMESEDSARLLSYDLSRGPLPLSCAFLPASNLPMADVRGFALASDGSLAWAKWYSPGESGDDKEAVYLLSPGRPIRCLTPDGGEPRFFDKTILWVGLKGDSQWLGGADTTTLETFTVAGGESVSASSDWSVAGAGHTAVVVVPATRRGATTLRIFDVQ